MRKTLRQPLLSTFLLTLAGTSLSALAQESPNGVSSELELGAIFTSGNTEGVNINPRSETSIQSDFMSNLSMKFAITVKNQSEVPIGRKKTDTEASVTPLLRL